jgi:hypothetical protein
MSKTVIVNGTSFCASCYALASKDAKGREELGQLIYDFLHYESGECN